MGHGWRVLGEVCMWYVCVCGLGGRWWWWLEGVGDGGGVLITSLQSYKAAAKGLECFCLFVCFNHFHQFSDCFYSTSKRFCPKLTTNYLYIYIYIVHTEKKAWICINVHVFNIVLILPFS